MKKLLLVLFALLVYALHQDVWYFDKLNVHLGFLPVGLWYQALYACLASFAMWVFGKYAWPKHLEEVEAEVLKKPHSGEGH